MLPSYEAGDKGVVNKGSEIVMTFETEFWAGWRVTGKWRRAWYAWATNRGASRVEANE
jgi:hypothetical protein